MSKIIGLPSVHDTGCALVIDGKVVFAMEEEKLTGVKALYTQNTFPKQTLNLIKQKFKIKQASFVNIGRIKNITSILDNRVFS